MNLAPTLSVVAAAGRHWDVAVIGAGPAGALAAHQAARAGLQTVLIERKDFPRSKVCGGCLSSRALGILEAVGLGRLTADAGAVAINRFELRMPGQRTQLVLPTGAALSREAFDAVLVREAIAAGAAFLPHTAARLLPSSDESEGHRELELQADGHAAPRLRARVVLAADGLGHPSLAGHPEFASRVYQNGRIGLGTVIEAAPAWCEPGTIFMAVAPQGYVGMVAVEAGRWNIAAAIDAQVVRRDGPQRAASAIATSCGLPVEREFEEAVWQGTPLLTREARHVAGHRVLLLGDAAGYVEPFTGEGIGWALAAGAAAVPLARRGQEHWSGDLATRWTRELRSLHSGRQLWCKTLAAILRRPLLSRCLLSIVHRAPLLARPVIRAIHSPGRLSRAFAP